MRRTAAHFVLVVAASLVLGGATSLAQSVLPAALSSFANSASGWTILCALLVFMARPRILTGAGMGIAGFVCLVLGYTLVSGLRGFAYAPAFWLFVAVVAGPVVGAAAAALHSASRGVSITGGMVLAAILIADGTRGLVELSTSTSPVYWILVIGLGLALIAWIFTRRLRVS
ncbi:MAG: DUF6518 family protein [Actinomycetes bacterium]